MKEQDQEQQGLESKETNDQTTNPISSALALFIEKDDDDDDDNNNNDDSFATGKSVSQKVHTGTLETLELSEFDFKYQQRQFQRKQSKNNITTTTSSNALDDENKDLVKDSISKKKRLKGGEAGDIEGFLGPWGGYEEEKKGETAMTAPNEEEIHRYLQEKSQIIPSTLGRHIELGDEKSVFHGKTERNELGKTYMTFEGINVQAEDRPLECTAPKKLIHTWNGHTKGVNCIRFLPKTGHLLLSASQDQRIKLWSVTGERQCLRTIYGHNKPVREVNFSPIDGSTFVSCGFDKTFKVWDTESGKCIFYRDQKSIPYCARFYPTDPNILLVGTANRRIVQVDLRANAVVTEYFGHKDAVNTITFFDDNKQFVTSSDDRTLRIWKFGVTTGTSSSTGINRNNNSTMVPTDRELLSMPYAAPHPTDSSLIAFQSLGNRIQIFSASHEGVTQRSKRFIGHATMGYGVQVGFSPDGKFIYSGDGRGCLTVWDWNSGAIARRIDAHKQVCMGVEWNPRETSCLATCSWDGTIKYWQ